MIDVAAKQVTSETVSFEAGDAQSLPFADSTFDVVVTQFGVMFFPDRTRAYREARRVLRPGGHFLFNVWDRIEENLASLLVAEAVADLFPENPPWFFQRTPFGYHDVSQVESDLRFAGFTSVDVETVRKRSQAADPEGPAEGLCLGTPLRAEIEARDVAMLDTAVEAARQRLAPLVAPNGLDALMSAHVFVASR